jgi:hypothetical protein
MKRIKAILVFLALTYNMYGQTILPEIKQILDSTIYYTKATSLYTKNVNWDTLEKKAFLLAANAQTVNDLKPALTFILNSLNDYHGRYLNPVNYAPIAWFTEWDRINSETTDKRERSKAVFNIINDTALKFSYNILNSNIGYLKIVGIGPAVNVEKEAKKIRNAVELLSSKKINKWIIDLRYNGGGNMNPMMAGIAPLIGNGFVGFLSNYLKDTLGKWSIQNNNFYWDGYQAVHLHNKPVFKTLPKLAVLTSRYTISSGEFVAATLKSRPHAKFFGEATGGYTTNTNWITIGNQLIICISSGFYCDRKGNMYMLNIPVDEEVVLDMEKKQENDDAVQAAIKWLKKK